MSGTAGIMGKVKIVLWILGGLAFVVGVLVLLSKFGAGIAAVFSALGFGGAGLVNKARKKARAKHEEVASGGPGAVADDNINRLRKRSGR